MSRIIKGWAFNKAVPSGLGNMPCIPFFKREYMADSVAEEWRHREGIKVVRATLTLDRPKQKRKPKK